MKHASECYSMTAFDAAVDLLFPEIKVINDATQGSVPRPERIKMVACKYFTIDVEDLSEKQIEALEIVRSVAKLFREHGNFVYGSKNFTVD